MAIYNVQTPTGIVKIEGPDDATDEELINAAQQQPAAPAEPERFKSEDYNNTLEITNPFSDKLGRVGDYVPGGQALAAIFGRDENLNTHIPIPHQLSTGLAGAGSLLTDQALAAKQMFGGSRTIKDIIAEKDAAKEKRLQDAPLMENTSAKVGKATGAVIEGVATAPLVGTGYLGAIGTGAAMGALQPTEDGQSRTQNTVVGGLLGAAGKYAGDKVLGLLAGKTAAPNILASSGETAGQTIEQQAVRDAMPQAERVIGDIKAAADEAGTAGGLTDTQKGLMEFGDKVGMQLTPGKRTGSMGLLQHEASLESNPVTSAPFNAIKENNSKIATRIAAQAIGENTDDLSGQVLRNAKERIGGVYKLVADNRPRDVNPDDLLGRLSTIETNLNDVTAGSIANQPLIKQFMDQAAKGNLTGKTLQDLSSKLNKASNNQITSAAGDRELGFALRDVKEMADDYLASGLDGKTAAKFAEARQQYRNLKFLDKYANAVNSGTGRVNVGTLGSAIKMDRNGFKYFGNDSPLYNLVRFNDAFRSTIGDSGTATRVASMMPNSFTEIPVALAKKAASKAYLSPPVASTLESAVNARQGAGNAINEGLLKNIDPKLAYMLSRGIGGSVAPAGLLYSQPQN